MERTWVTPLSLLTEIVLYYEAGVATLYRLISSVPHRGQNMMGLTEASKLFKNIRRLVSFCERGLKGSSLSGIFICIFSKDGSL